MNTMLPKLSKINRKIKTFSIKANGNSMFPTLQNGDIVEYIESTFNTTHINDIVLVCRNNMLFAHRVIYKTKDVCITRGDNNFTADEPIRKEDILAKVIRFKRNKIWHELQDVYYVQSAFYMKEIQKLETILSLHSIPHVFLKGVLISLRYEGDIPKRVYADCDLLVYRKDFERVKKAFRLLKYIPLKEPPSFLDIEKMEDRTEISFIRYIKNVPVVFDLHLEPVFSMPRLKESGVLYSSILLKKFGESLIDNCQKINIKGMRYPLCSIPNQILYLTLHIFNHSFTDNFRYQLLYAAIKNKATKKTYLQLTQVISQYNLNGYVYPVFLLLNKYYDDIIPQEFMNTIIPRHISQIYIAKRIASQTDIFSIRTPSFPKLKRFITIFLLSPGTLFKKLTKFLYPQALYTAICLAISFITFQFKNNTTHGSYKN